MILYPRFWMIYTKHAHRLRSQILWWVFVSNLILFLLLDCVSLCTRPRLSCSFASLFFEVSLNAHDIPIYCGLSFHLCSLDLFVWRVLHCWISIRFDFLNQCYLIIRSFFHVTLKQIVHEHCTRFLFLFKSIFALDRIAMQMALVAG